MVRGTENLETAGAVGGRIEMMVTTWPVSLAVARGLVVHLAVVPGGGTSRTLAAVPGAAAGMGTGMAPDVVAFPAAGAEVGTPGAPAGCGDDGVAPLTAPGGAGPGRERAVEPGSFDGEHRTHRADPGRRFNPTHRGLVAWGSLRGTVVGMGSGTTRRVAARGAVRELYRSWCRHRGGALSAELLLFALLSALPIALCVTAALGKLRRVVGADLARQLEEWAVAQAAEVVGERSPVLEVIRDVFEAPSGRALTVGLVFAAYAAARGFISLVGSLDVVFSTHSTRGWVAQRLTGMWLAFLSLVMLPGSLTLVYTSRELARGVSKQPVLWFVLDKAVGLAGYLLAIAWLATLYHLAPRDKLRWRDHLVGAAACVGAVAALTRIVRWWLGVFGANAVFGVIGAAMSLLWWGYLVSCCLFLGAEITAWRSSRAGRPLDPR